MTRCKIARGAPDSVKRHARDSHDNHERVAAYRLRKLKVSPHERSKDKNLIGFERCVGEFFHCAATHSIHQFSIADAACIHAGAA